MAAFYRRVPLQLAVFVLFQVFMWVDFHFTGYGLLGAYGLDFVFCLIWGNVGYVVLSDAFFCVVTLWLSGVGFPANVDISFWYLLFTFVPTILIVYIRNAILFGIPRH